MLTEQEKITIAICEYNRLNGPFKAQYNGGNGVDIVNQSGRPMRKYLVSDIIKDYDPTPKTTKNNLKKK